MERSRWIVNNDQSTLYDGLIVTIGTCGPPQFPKWAEEMKDSLASDGDNEKHSHDTKKPIIIHSSELDSLDDEIVRKMGRIVVVGSGASGVEAVEWVMENVYNSSKCYCR